MAGNHDVDADIALQVGIDFAEYCASDVAGQSSDVGFQRSHISLCGNGRTATIWATRPQHQQHADWTTAFAITAATSIEGRCRGIHRPLMDFFVRFAGRGVHNGGA